jgi:hypothetical protein
MALDGGALGVMAVAAAVAAIVIGVRGAYGLWILALVLLHLAVAQTCQSHHLEDRKLALSHKWYLPTLTPFSPARVRGSAHGAPHRRQPVVRVGLTRNRSAPQHSSATMRVPLKRTRSQQAR